MGIIESLPLASSVPEWLSRRSMLNPYRFWYQFVAHPLRDLRLLLASRSASSSLPPVQVASSGSGPSVPDEGAVGDAGEARAPRQVVAAEPEPEKPEPEKPEPEKPMGLRTVLLALQSCDRVSAESVMGPFQVSSGEDEAPVVCFQFRMSHFTCKAYLAHGAQDEGSQHLKLQTIFEDNRRSLGEEQRFFVANEWNATKRYTRLKCGTGSGAGRSSVFTLEYDVLVPGDTPHSWGLTLVSQTLRMWYTSMVACVMHIVEPRDMPFATHEMITANTLAVTVREEDTALLQESCPICFESFQVGEKVRRLPCMHCFHVVGADVDSSQGRHCNIDKHLTCDKTCPVCKTPIDIMERMNRSGTGGKNAALSSSGSASQTAQDAAVSDDGEAAAVAAVVTALGESSAAEPLRDPVATAVSSANPDALAAARDGVAAPDVVQRYVAGLVASATALPAVGGQDGAVVGENASPAVDAAAGAAALLRATALGEQNSTDAPVAAATAAVAAATALVANVPGGDARTLGVTAAAGLPAQAAELERAVRSLQSRWLQIQDVVAGMQQMLQYIEESQTAIRAAESRAAANGEAPATGAGTEEGGTPIDATLGQESIAAVPVSVQEQGTLGEQRDAGTEGGNECAMGSSTGPAIAAENAAADLTGESAEDALSSSAPPHSNDASNTAPTPDESAASQVQSRPPPAVLPAGQSQIASGERWGNAVGSSAAAVGAALAAAQRSLARDAAGDSNGEGNRVVESMRQSSLEAGHGALDAGRPAANDAALPPTPPLPAQQQTTPSPAGMQPTAMQQTVLLEAAPQPGTSPWRPDGSSGHRRSDPWQPFTEAEQVCMAFVWRQRRAAARASTSTLAAPA